MDETPRETPRADTTSTHTASSPTGGPPKHTGKGMLWAILAVVIAFFAGFLWQFYEATTVRTQLSETEQELVLERLRIHLGQAALAAQTGEYEAARRQMSNFFDRIQQQAPMLPAGVDSVARDFLAMRDDIITGLSRSNPEYAAVLHGMHQELGDAIDRALGSPGAGAGVEDGTGTGPEPEGASPEGASPESGAAGADSPGGDGG